MCIDMYIDMCVGMYMDMCIGIHYICANMLDQR